MRFPPIYRTIPTASKLQVPGALVTTGAANMVKAPSGKYGLLS
jgi:hypothetical protein